MFTLYLRWFITRRIDQIVQRIEIKIHRGTVYGKGTDVKIRSGEARKSAANMRWFIVAKSIRAAGV